MHNDPIFTRRDGKSFGAGVAVLDPQFRTKNSGPSVGEGDGVLTMTGNNIAIAQAPLAVSSPFGFIDHFNCKRYASLKRTYRSKLGMRTQDSYGDTVGSRA